ncbi:hypothetical protein DPEC_G00296160 [Dallia pectoralis]|uniref:Uncharacterized protein n=1 Tax=Dallia pectoralis TaxID=75939 RepID=A0ACC2FIX4_DALPE|nr:hypothetical protein DPEC_G00296160 [Dallia pectoralis]
MKRRFDEKHKAKWPAIRVSDWVRARRPHRANKLSSFWSAPYQVSRQLGPASFQLTDGSRWHASCLRRVPSPFHHPHLAGVEQSNPATEPAPHVPDPMAAPLAQAVPAAQDTAPASAPLPGPLVSEPRPVRDAHFTLRILTLCATVDHKEVKEKEHKEAKKQAKPEHAKKEEDVHRLKPKPSEKEPKDTKEKVKPRLARKVKSVGKKLAKEEKANAEPVIKDAFFTDDEMPYFQCFFVDEDEAQFPFNSFSPFQM